MRVLASIALAGLAFSVGCNSLLDFSSYKVEPGAADAGDQDVSNAPECATNAECIAKLGDFSICRKSDFKCAKLLSPDCPNVLGDWKDDNALVFGSILPIVGPDKAGGLPQYDAIAVAVDDFKQGSNGLPPAKGTTARRPIVVVGCSEESDDPNDVDAPTRSAQHLVNDVKVPAIIGDSFSGDTQTSAQVTIPGGVLLMSPSATSVAITDLADNGLVWRTSPSDVIQAKALTTLFPQVEASTRSRLGLGDPMTRPLRVLIVNKGDSYGKGLAAALQQSLVFNGKPATGNASTDFNTVDFGDPSSGTVDYSVPLGKINALISSTPPDVVFLLGTNEIITNIMVPLEAASWPMDKKPTYLLADGGLVPELWGAVGSNTELRKRVFGSAPGTNNDIYKIYRQRYLSFINDGTSPDVGTTAGAYDALYVLAYAAATIDGPITGAGLNEGLKRVVPPGTASTPGLLNINTALGILASGQNIDYNGASGPLDFDVVKGEAPSDIQIWCLPADAKGNALPGINSGIFYNAQTSMITGGTLDPLDATTKMTCNF